MTCMDMYSTVPEMRDVSGQKQVENFGCGILQICEAVRYVRQGRETREAEIPNLNEKANGKLPKLTVG